MLAVLIKTLPLEFEGRQSAKCRLFDSNGQPTDRTCRRYEKDRILADTAKANSLLASPSVMLISVKGEGLH